MKNYLKLSVIFCAVAALTMGSASAQRLKIATVDMQKLFKEYHRTTEEQQTSLHDSEYCTTHHPCETTHP